MLAVPDVPLLLPSSRCRRAVAVAVAVAHSLAVAVAVAIAPLRRCRFLLLLRCRRAIAVAVAVAVAVSISNFFAGNSLWVGQTFVCLCVVCGEKMHNLATAILHAKMDVYALSQHKQIRLVFFWKKNQGILLFL